MQGHRHDKTWWPSVAETEVETFATSQDVAEAEQAQIRTLKPLCNAKRSGCYADKRRPYMSSPLSGTKLRRLRMTYILSHRELAIMAGLSPTTVLKLENAEVSTPHLRTIRKLAAA